MMHGRLFSLLLYKEHKVGKSEINDPLPDITVTPTGNKNPLIKRNKKQKNKTKQKKKCV